MNFDIWGLWSLDLFSNLADCHVSYHWYKYFNMLYYHYCQCICGEDKEACTSQSCSFHTKGSVGKPK